MNAALAEITGRPGDVSDRTIRNLLNGTSRRPIGRTCAALERVFGCPVEDLGFSAPRTMQHPQEDPVRRRTFLTSATGSAAAAVPLVAQRRTVGMSDVARVAAGMNALSKPTTARADTRHWRRPPPRAAPGCWTYSSATPANASAEPCTHWPPSTPPSPPGPASTPATSTRPRAT
ncbi:hypothetical protein [Streptomyces hayashii]|uniref:hypothetical protein n=1 Tax=Streptomyces hayashii TaxID=2839966 RepID=UPI00403C58EA